MKKKKPYWSWRWWLRWFVPLPVLVWYSKKHFGNHVWYQDDDVNVELYRRFYRKTT